MVIMERYRLRPLGITQCRLTRIALKRLNETWKKNLCMLTSINPIILLVKDYGRALKFYKDILGLSLASAEEPEEEFATFDIGGTVFALHGGYDGEIREGNIALHFVTMDIHREVERLKAQGVSFTKPIKKMPWGAYQASFVDPEGNEFDLMQHPKDGPIM